MRDLATFSLLIPLLAFAQSPCVGGMAAGNACANIDLMSYRTIAQLNGGSCLNDCWGWTDPLDQKEYALVGACNGTSFVDITDPVNPVLVGRLPTRTFNSSWRDIKVYADHAYIVSEASNHGMQVFDLTRLRNVASPPVIFTQDTALTIFGNAHNIAINEDIGMAYVVGANQCGGGLYMIDITDPDVPFLAGCYDLDGYIHDTQCVVYHGPDTDHAGAHICINSHSGIPDKKTIVDVTDPSDPMQISSINWPNARIGHQGWLTEDHKYFLLGDEGDESNAGHNTRTYVFDVQDLDNPFLIGWHDGTNASIDHNQYIHKGLVWQANYSSGLQVLELVDLPTASLQQVGWFDTYPAGNGVGFDGAWSNYPYFPSGNVIVSDYDIGFYVVRPNLFLGIRAFLEGPYNAGSGLMNDDLRGLGFLPTTEPYTLLGYTFVDGGGETTDPSVLTTTGSDAIVDWVVVELRSKEDSTVVMASRAALIQRDGDIVDVDGTSRVQFKATIDDYYIVLKHRNHLGIMTAQPLRVSLAPRDYDLTDNSLPLFGSAPTKDVSGVRVMWTGDATFDGALKYTGNGNDRDPILQVIGGSVPTNTVSGYLLEDVDLDGVAKYTGSDNDRDPILQNIGGSIPTNVRPEQVP